jgi:hypothetical protein
VAHSLTSPHLLAGPALPFPPCPEENSFLLMCTIRAQRVLAKGLFLGLCIIVASTRVCVMAFTRRWNPSPFPNVFVSWKARGGPHHISDLDEKVDVSLVSNDNYFWRHSKEELKRVGISRSKKERKQKKKTMGDNKRKLRTRENDGRTGRSYFADSCHTHTHTGKHYADGKDDLRSSLVGTDTLDGRKNKRIETISVKMMRTRYVPRRRWKSAKCISGRLLFWKNKK